MTFVKKQLTPFSSAAADPLFNFSQPFIQQGVISGRYYSADEVAYGNPKPGYLEPSANSNVVTVVASTAVPLRLVFALGLHDANTGGEIGSWRTFTGKTSSNVSVTVSSSEKGWIYAEINENGQPNNPGAWTITYANEPAKDRTYSSQETEPVAPVDGDVWFNPITNVLKKYNGDTSQWDTKKRVYLGEAGVGNNGYVYTVQSWYPELGYAQYQDSFYPPYYENPWRHYDGVSFLTDGQYTAMEAANWANNFTIGQAVAGNATAMNAIANSAFAMENIAQASNTMNAIANSVLAIQSLTANTSGSALSFVGNSSVAMTQIGNTGVVGVMSILANNSPFIQTIANNATSQQHIISGNSTSRTEFYNTIVNNNITLSLLRPGTAGNLLFELIGTNTYYQTITANNQGQLLALTNTISGPILATGGTVSEINVGGTDFRVHEFLSTSSLNVRTVGEQANVQYVVVAGGGGGSNGTGAGRGGGGGGAGGYRTNVPGQLSGTGCSAEPALAISFGNHTVSIGGGGAGSPTVPGVPASLGSNSSFFGITSCRGGLGSGHQSTPPQASRDGGSGGGSYYSNVGAGSGISGQGRPGGPASGGMNDAGGGGGAICAGGSAQSTNNPAPVLNPACGVGGAGACSNITGTTRCFAGGGGGNDDLAPRPGGIGGGGRGSCGSGAPGITACPGTVNTGGGGGGTKEGAGGCPAGNGGSGIVIVRYPIDKV